MRLVLIYLIALVSCTTSVSQDKITDVKNLYNEITSDYPKPKYEIFEKAIKGYNKLKQNGILGDKNLLTVLDFSLSANKKRLWIIDLNKKKIVEHSLVSHGKNTGQEFAKYFSNAPQSYKSSLGFYITGNTYHGKHGLSLNLDGVEKGINDNAMKRRIVMHGAKYVSFDFIKKHGRLGRSFGCPAVPIEKNKKIIDLIKNKTCLFIYYPKKEYLEKSKLLIEK